MSLDSQLFLDVANILRKRIPSASVGVLLQNDLPIITETFRFLRNSVASCKRNQDFIREKTDIIDIATHILDHVTDFNGISLKEHDMNNGFEVHLIVARCCLQFLMNFMVENENNARILVSSSTIHSMYVLTYNLCHLNDTFILIHF